MLIETIEDGQNLKVDKDGVGNARMRVWENGRVLFDLAVGCAQLRSPAKRMYDQPSGDQLLHARVGNNLVYGVFDGVMPVQGELELFRRRGEDVFTQEELRRHKDTTGEDLSDVVMTLDALAAITIAKIFPLTERWKQLARNKDLTARAIMLEADAYLKDVLSACALQELAETEEALLPAAVGGLILINFETSMLSSAQIGEPKIQVMEWDQSFENDPWLLLSHEPVLLSDAQGEREDLELFLKCRSHNVGRESKEFFNIVLDAYRAKRNVTVGILNSRLNPSLIVDKTIPLNRVFEVFMCTDGADLLNLWSNSVLAYLLLSDSGENDKLLPMFINQAVAARFDRDRFPFQKPDDASAISLSLWRSPHINVLANNRKHQGTRLVDLIKSRYQARHFGYYNYFPTAFNPKTNAFGRIVVPGSMHTSGAIDGSGITRGEPVENFVFHFYDHDRPQIGLGGGLSMGEFD